MSQPDYQTLIGLVGQYSPSGQEQAAVKWLVERMQVLGYSQAYTDAAGNAVGVIGTGTRQIVLLGHIDTVPGDIQLRIEKGVFYGRGTVDAKGALASFVDAAAQVGARPGWQMVVIGAVDEERESVGARYAVGRYQPEYALIGEPNRWERIALGYKGSAGATVSVHKTQFHSARAEQSASEAAVEAWLSIKAFAEQFNQARERAFDQLLVSLRELASGSDGFEQWARLGIGARLPLDLDPAAWYEQLAGLAPEAQVEPVGYALPAWAVEKNTRLVRAFLSSIRGAGGTPGFVYKTGTADLNVVAPVWRCPAVVYGPGDSALDHTPGECIELEEYQRAVGVLRGVLEMLMAKSD